MLKWIIIAACVLVIFVVRIVMGLLKNVPQISTALFYSCIVLTVLGLFLVGYNADRLTRLSARKSWPTAPGRVIESEVHGTEAIRPLVVYSYDVGGVSYTDSSTLEAPTFGNGRKEYEVARDLSQEHPEGSYVRVYYDPSNPAESVLMPEAPWDIYGKIGLGGTLLMLGLFGVLLPRRKISAS